MLVWLFLSSLYVMDQHLHHHRWTRLNFESAQGKSLRINKIRWHNFLLKLGQFPTPVHCTMDQRLVFLYVQCRCVGGLQIKFWIMLIHHWLLCTLNVEHSQTLILCIFFSGEGCHSRGWIALCVAGDLNTSNSSWRQKQRSHWAVHGRTSECSFIELWANREKCDGGVLLKFYFENEKMQSRNLVSDILPAVISRKRDPSSLSALRQRFLFRINSHYNHSSLAMAWTCFPWAMLQFALADTKCSMLCSQTQTSQQLELYQDNYRNSSSATQF